VKGLDNRNIWQKTTDWYFEPKSFEKEILSYNYLAARQSILLDNKTLPDVYKAILESFHAFTPTKS